MANANTARGIVPYKFTSGAPYNGAANVYYVPASYGTAIYVGDPVLPAGTSDANGIPSVTVATAGATNFVLGAMVGIVSAGQPIIPVTRDLPVYHPASTAGYILVADDPNLLFWSQEDSVGGAMSTDDAMANIDLVSGTGSTTTGYSGWMIDSSTAGTGNTKQMRVLSMLQEADNAIGVNAKWLCKINLHSLLNPLGV